MSCAKCGPFCLSLNVRTSSAAFYLEDEDSDFVHYVMLRAVQRFYSEYNRYPGYYNESLEADIPKLKVRNVRSFGLVKDNCSPQFIHCFPRHTKYSWVHYNTVYRADSRFAPCQWETALLCNSVSHWLGVSLESALGVIQHYITYSTAVLQVEPNQRWKSQNSPQISPSQVRDIGCFL